MFETMPTTALADAVDHFRQTERDGWSDVAFLDDLKDAIDALRSLETMVHLMVGTAEAAGMTVDGGGAAGTAAWLVREAGLSKSKAQQLTRTARFLNRNAATADALECDDVSLDHVKAISAVVSTRRDQVYAEHEETVLDAARSLPIGDFATVVRRWASLADDQLADSDHMTQHEHRRWHYATGMGGTVTTDGFFDPVSGATLIKAIETLCPPDPADTPGGPRTSAQRRADALVEMARRCLKHGDGDEPAERSAKGSVATVSVIVDYETLTGVQATLDKARCDLEWVGPVGRSTIQRITCDSALHRIVMHGANQILNVGRQRRLVNTTQRKALIARDGGCIGCGRPAAWCEAHHIVSWADGGTTDIDNLVLVCPRCHTLLHEARWTVRTHHGRFELVPPTWHPP